MEGLSGQRILVTGGTGFVGSHLVEVLVKRGNRVIVPFRSLDPYSYFASVGLDKKTVLTVCDIRDNERVFDIVTRYEVDSIVHLAAQSIVATAYANPEEAITSNVVGTTNILDAARRNKRVTGVIVASSDKAYGKSKREYEENHPLAGDHPYEVSKSAADLIAQAYFKTYALPVVITRFGNIYGPGDLNFNRIIPGLIKSIIAKEKLEIRSDGTFVRDYIYVKDVVSAYLTLLAHLEKVKGEAFNISTSDSYSVVALIKKSEHILRKKVQYVIQNTQVNEIPYQHLNWDKIKKLGWKPKYTLPRGLTETYHWYKKNKKVFRG